MLVFNPEWEKLKIPLALEEMIKGLTVGFFKFSIFFDTYQQGAGDRASDEINPPQGVVGFITCIPK